MTDLFDVFDVAVADSEAADSACEAYRLQTDDDVVHSPVSEAELDPCRDWFSVAVLTVPDLNRFPIPERFVADKVPVDLSDLAKSSMAETRALITATLPDEQLQEILIAERAREKPRQAVLKAVNAEIDDRGPGFEKWVSDLAGNVFQSRIVGIAWQGAGELHSEAPQNDFEETLSLTKLASVLEEFRVNRPYSKFTGLHIGVLRGILSVRAAALGVNLNLPAFCCPIYDSLHGVIAAAGGLRVVAEACGVARHEIAEVPTAMEVFTTFRRMPGDRQLADWAAGRLEMEREVLKVLIRI